MGLGSCKFKCSQPGSVPSVSKENGRNELGWAGAPGNHTLPAKQFHPMLRPCLIFQEESEIQPPGFEMLATYSEIVRRMREQTEGICVSISAGRLAGQLPFRTSTASTASLNFSPIPPTQTPTLACSGCWLALW